ncbi:DUF1735 domain-containing protein [Chitinophagaceae bacterium LB-8]|uniref:DUF1735 domain-containing protein n=1 Tax=Paraflavisolibacter caeni TaxID=2982496 RepID=A0A9X2XYL3_9BACT|nr:DUF1735 domain-containing protein [Paraflavisolibacter caeni]MCU7551057.1 DUF1735 domain-containing protein [Paraflavisolibacter caeni]
MKSINKFLLHSSACLLLMVLGVSCLKDDDYDEGKENININKSIKLVEIMGPIEGFYTKSLDYSTGDTTVQLVNLNLAALDPAPEDLKVTLAVDPAVIADFNARNDENFTPLPASYFNFPTMDATIPKGQREAVLSGTIKNPSFLESGKYALGMKVANVSNPDIKISGNYGQQLISLRVKNKYHGLYHAAGVFHHPTAGDRDIDEEKELTTEEPNSVLAPLGDLGGAGYQMLLIINADNSVTIEPRGVTPNIDQHWGRNYYDPATKSFHLHYSYNTSAPRIVEEVITRE